MPTTTFRLYKNHQRTLNCYYLCVIPRPQPHPLLLSIFSFALFPFSLLLGKKPPKTETPLRQWWCRCQCITVVTLRLPPHPLLSLFPISLLMRD
ncbi:hypothetical protein Hanom_Chr16g01466531 [Helianthus anomalus]